ncbi:uncharacterized protein LOC144135999 [Amblyomma americanum]
MEENDLRRAKAHQVLPQIISSMEEGSAEHGGTYGKHIRALRLLHVLLTPGAEVTLTHSNDGSEEGGPCQQENVAQGPEECGFSVEEDKNHKKDPEVPRRSTAVRDARLIHKEVLRHPPAISLLSQKATKNFHVSHSARPSNRKRMAHHAKERNRRSSRVACCQLA